MKVNEWGVSEAIGYIIIFGLVMTGIGLITLYGYPVLMQQESQANIKNMEQTMIVLQNDLKSLTYKLVPYKETTLRVSGGTLTLYPGSLTPQSFSVYRASNLGSPELIFGGTGPGSEQNHLGELRFTALKENAVIALENGAVIERREGVTGSYMLAEPRWFQDSNTLMLNFVSLGNTTASSRSELLSETGVGIVRMNHFQTLHWSIDPNPPNGEPIVIKYTPDPANDYSTAWKNFLTKSDGLNMEEWDPVNYPNYYRTRVPITKLVVREYDVIVESI